MKRETLSLLMVVILSSVCETREQLESVLEQIYQTPHFSIDQYKSPELRCSNQQSNVAVAISGGGHRTEIVDKVWNYFHVLRAFQNLCEPHQVFLTLLYGIDGEVYGFYVEQITSLIFLKMADDREQSLLTTASSGRYML